MRRDDHVLGDEVCAFGSLPGRGVERGHGGKGSFEREHEQI